MPDQNDVTRSPAAPTQAAKEAKRDVRKDIAEAQDELRRDLSDVAGTAKREMSAAGREASAQIERVQAEAKAQAMEVAEQAKSFVSQQKDLAADQLDGVADAVAKTADEIENTTVAGYARDLAGGIRQVSEGVRTRSLEDIVNAAADFGRRQPIAFLGAAALAGFAASRFMRASAERRQDSMPNQAGMTGQASSSYRPAEASGSFGNGHLSGASYGESH
jgi:hypothetical protein